MKSMLLRSLASLSVVAYSGCAAAQALPEPASEGSPSNVASTVSPATVAQNTNLDQAVEPMFTISTGVSYASGDFGSARDTSIIAAPLTIQATVEGVRLSANLPYMSIRSRGTIFTGIDSTPVIVAGDTGQRRVTNSGLGDLTLGVTYALAADSQFVDRGRAVGSPQGSDGRQSQRPFPAERLTARQGCS